MSKLTEVWGGSKAQIADKVRIYSDKTNKIPSFVMLTLLHEAMREIDELEHIPTVSNFREWMVSEMDAKGITSKELACRSGISASTVEKTIKGKNSPTLKTACAIAEALL